MSYVSSYYHCVFSTKERRPLITPGLQERLWPYLGGIARQNEMKTIEIGGVADHVHILLSLPSTLSIAKAMQLIKGGSSKWVHDSFPEHRLFDWQVKYGAFGVSVSLLDKTIQYIRNQAEHHRKMTFQEEFLALLKKHAYAVPHGELTERHRVGGHLGVQEDVGAPSVELVEHRIERGVTDIGPRSEEHTSELQS